MKKILQELINGNITMEEAEKKLKTMQIEELGDFAKIDTGRDLRTGFPEAILAEGKDDQDLIKIIQGCAKRGRVMVTRLEEDRYHNIKDEINFIQNKSLKVEYNRKARILLLKDGEIEKRGKIGIITAGTSDIPVAEEARIVAEEAGCEVLTSYDVGVAGIHRLFSKIRWMLEEDVKAIIVVAGMEGALPSVVAGLVDVPVVGVPTSVGYGVGKGGFTALNAMLQSCAPGIAVVNIDNGFGAAIFAATVIKQRIK
ncbi:nickel pincer cofactor biosynthesis protein LarB [Methanobacterium formicicum]|uniref:1-(5-phosphoribosyl)-5-amino-4-imidazole-carboxylate (AIR) carboxylase n=1 Tax=Methanobacterium formicicum (strain DSM 3637 / PP1) TaxID=1204725 RepID=K2R2K9_METFP|nr:nickel pincer cofactor biosynthesis protein LarB [Methanobacterium formicicum]EKF86768.1 1-(5-phosphoribosyl)-5-amino-4-imidazole-carboxylate (AIR) carboxylase [Methanobacterium formicicum DSM 3637]